MSETLRRIGTKLRRYREHIVAFVVEQFGVEPDRWQVEALEAFASPDPAKRRISLQACVGPGKTAVLAWAGLHFLGTLGERGEHPKGAAVAVTFENLRDNLWPELAKWMARSPFFRQAFTWTQTRVFANDGGIGAHRKGVESGARTLPAGVLPGTAGSLDGARAERSG